MPVPTTFEIKCATESMGTPWPDLATIKFLDPVDIEPVAPAPAEVVTRSCIRCQQPVEGERCSHCRAIQSTYKAKR